MRSTIIGLTTFFGMLTWYAARIILSVTMLVLPFIAGAQFQRDLTAPAIFHRGDDGHVTLTDCIANFNSDQICATGTSIVGTAFVQIDECTVTVDLGDRTYEEFTDIINPLPPRR